MVRIYQLLIIFGTIAAMILLIGCGQRTTTDTTGLFTATTTPSPTTTNAPTRTATNAPTRTTNPGPVTLHVDAQSYRSTDTITVTLINQSNQTIYFPDHLTNCSVILLLRLKVQPLTSDSGQAAIEPCKSEIATWIHSLAAGQSLVVRLIAPINGWSPGIYHAMLSYYTSLKKTPTTISSTAFVVGPFTPQP